MGAVSKLTVSTTWGPILVQADGGKIVACDVAHAELSKSQKTFSIKTSKIDHKIAANDKAVLKKADGFIRGLFSGKFKSVPDLAIPEGTDFQRKVWKQLSKTEPGQTLSYGDVAKKAGKPKAFRAAGQACGANKIPFFIPCHRVLAASGELGGFSCGLAWKELLLNIESEAATKSARRRTS